MAGMIPLGMMDQNYERYIQGSANVPFGIATYDEQGTPMSGQQGPVMHNSLVELGLSENPNLSAVQMQQVNADWNRPELFEGEHNQRTDFGQQLAGAGPGAYPGPKGSLATRGRGASTLNAMQPIGQPSGLEIADAYQNPEMIQELTVEKKVEELAAERKRDDSMKNFMQRIYSMGQQLQSNAGPMAAFGQMARGGKGGYTPYKAQTR